MNFEVLKRSHIKRNILIGVMIVLILSAVILTFTRAKYRVTQSVPLVSGTINFLPYDFNVVAMYLNKGDETVSTTKAPHVGYTLNESQSTCVVDDEEAEGYEILYDSGLLDFNNLSYAGTKCSVYFDLIPDSEAPVINSIGKGSSNSSITVRINATDNIGIFYYYFKLDDGEEIRSESSTYTFEGLVKDQTYKVSVRVEDAAGNTAEANDNIKVGSIKDVILANYSDIRVRTDFDSVLTETTSNVIYHSLDESQYDDYGEVYYFAGNPTDNWVSFANFYWRIIRINGDGTLRLFYAGDNFNALNGKLVSINSTVAFNYYPPYPAPTSPYNNMYMGYMYTENQLHGLSIDSTVKQVVDEWYRNNLIDFENYLSGSTGFCGDREVASGTGIGQVDTVYAGYIRLVNQKAPTYKCTNDEDLYTTLYSENGNSSLQYPIGLISADEASFAGGVARVTNTGYYLYNDTDNIWTMTAGSVNSNSRYAGVFNITSNGSLDNYRVNDSHAVSPVINLKADVQVVSGDGTQANPYVIAT